MLEPESLPKKCFFLELEKEFLECQTFAKCSDLLHYEHFAFFAGHFRSDTM